MTNSDQIKEIVFNAIDEVNGQLAHDKKIIKAETTALFGSTATLDSLTLINLVAIIEENLAVKTGKSTLLSNLELFSTQHSPLSSVGSLLSHIETSISE